MTDKQSELYSFICKLMWRSCPIEDITRPDYTFDMIGYSLTKLFREGR